MNFPKPAIPASILTTCGLFIVLAFSQVGCDSDSSDAVLRINCGGPKVDGWVSDKEYLDKDGRKFRFGEDVKRKGVEDPAPDKVYETVRHQRHSYKIPLPEGRYLVRLHFVDAYKSAKRAMDYLINGQLVIDNLDVEKAAGGIKRALVLEAVAEVAKGKPLVIEASEDKGSDVFQAGIEIFPADKNTALTTTPINWRSAGSRTGGGTGAPSSTAKVAADNSISSRIRAFTGAPTKIVWLEGPKWELYTEGRSQVRLIGLDTEDGMGPRDLLDRDMGLSKPLITPDGKSVIVTDRKRGRILQVGWNSGEIRDLAEGWASDVWVDPKTGRQWVYHRSGKGGQKDPIQRFPIDDPKAEESVWSRSETGHGGVPWFQLSADGKYFAEGFPWPRCGMGSVEKRDWEHFTKGCWPGMSPDNSYRMYVFDGNHREITMFHGKRDKKNKIDLSKNIPGQKGKKVYHLQWSNHPRHLTLASPEHSDRNEVYLGRFDKDWKGVEEWIQVTDNKRAESFSDAWIATGTVAK